MNSSVIVFPGSNCDRDIAVALEKLQFKNKNLYQNTPNEQVKRNNYGHLLNDKVIVAQEIDFIL